MANSIDFRRIILIILVIAIISLTIWWLYLITTSDSKSSKSIGRSSYLSQDSYYTKLDSRREKDQKENPEDEDLSGNALDMSGLELEEEINHNNIIDLLNQPEYSLKPTYPL